MEGEQLTTALTNHMEFIQQQTATPTVEILTRLADLQGVLVQTVEFITSSSNYETNVLTDLENCVKEFLKTARSSHNFQPRLVALCSIDHAVLIIQY